MKRVACCVCALMCALGTSVVSAQSTPSGTTPAVWAKPPFPDELPPVGDPKAAPPSPPAPVVVPPPSPPVPCAAPECNLAPAPFDWSKFRLGGQYRIEGDTNNFLYHPLFLTNNQNNDTFVNQRFRTWLTYTPTDNVEGYIQMQVGGLNWGTNFDSNKNSLADFSLVQGDRVGIELRRAWLSVKDDCWGKVRVGILDWHDSFGDTLASSDYDFNTGGIDWVNTYKEFNNLQLHAAMLLLSDNAFANTNASDEPGAHTAYLFALDADQPLMKGWSFGGSVYYLTDRGNYSYPTLAPYSSSWDLWVGVRAHACLAGTLPIGGFFLVNTGEREDYGPTSFNHTGFATRLEAGPIPVGPGKFSTQFVFASGDDHPGTGNSSEFRTVAQTARDNFGAQGYWGYGHVTAPNGPDDVRDLGVSLQDQGYGLFAVQGKYEMPLTAKLTSTSMAGWMRSAATNARSGGSVIGTELGEMLSYNFGGGLTLDVGAAVLFTGDFYRASPTALSPDNLYEGFARLQLEF